jgi:hypothetical protein
MGVKYECIILMLLMQWGFKSCFTADSYIKHIRLVNQIIEGFCISRNTQNAYEFT